MPRRVLVMMTGVLQVLGLPAGAAEFRPSWDAEGVWTSNVFKSVDNQESDYSIRTGPKLRVVEPRGDLTYDVYYQFSYQGYAQIEGLSDIEDADQYFAGRGTWRATPTTRITATDVFAYTTNLDTLFDEGALVSTVAVGRERVTTNFVEASLEHDLSPIWQLTASVSNRIYHYQSPNQSNTSLTNGTLQITRAMNRRLIVGGGSQYQRQEFAEVEEFPGRGTSVYQAFGVVNYHISPTFRMLARAGPAFVQPDAIEVANEVVVPAFFFVDTDTCETRNGVPVILRPNPNAGGTDCRAPVVPSSAPRFLRNVPFVGDSGVGDSLNYFGTLSITKEWRQWSAAFGYSRSASNSSGLNGSTVLDELTGSVVWTPSDKWQVNFDAIYSIQSALNEAPQQIIALQPDPDIDGIAFPTSVDSASIKNEIDLTTMYFTVSANRRISRRLSLIGSAVYWQQKSGGLLQDSTLNDIQLSLGFTWTFDPIPL